MELTIAPGLLPHALAFLGQHAPDAGDLRLAIRRAGRRLDGGLHVRDIDRATSFYAAQLEGLVGDNDVLWDPPRGMHNWDRLAVFGVRGQKVAMLQPFASLPLPVISLVFDVPDRWTARAIGVRTQLQAARTNRRVDALDPVAYCWEWQTGRQQEELNFGFVRNGREYDLSLTRPLPDGDAAAPWEASLSLTVEPGERLSSSVENPVIATSVMPEFPDVHYRKVGENQIEFLTAAAVKVYQAPDPFPTAEEAFQHLAGLLPDPADMPDGTGRKPDSRLPA